jgi:hypothetical protein
VKLRLTRSFDDIPLQATDDELLAWSATLGTDAPVATPCEPEPAVTARPKVVVKDISHLSDDELFADIFERAAAVSGARSA